MFFFLSEALGYLLKPLVIILPLLRSVVDLAKSLN